MSSQQDSWSMPTVPGKYMKFKQGANKFRILDEPIKGFEYWVTGTTEDGREKRTPIRKRPDEKIPVGEIEANNPVRPFMAYVVWNYADNAVQVLCFTQKTIADPIGIYRRQKDWGDPVGTDGYDFVVTKTGEGKDGTKYNVIANPKKKLDKEIIKAFKEVTINLEALFESKDPFEVEEKAPAEEAEVKPEDIKI